MSALQLKCYLIGAPSTDQIAKSTEIRRFVLAQPTSSGFYGQLIEKIQQAFGAQLLPERDEIKTYWLDDENEMVCFSTDGELQYAVDLHMAVSLSANKPYETSNGGVFKVYVVRSELQRGCGRRRHRMRAAAAAAAAASSNGAAAAAAGNEDEKMSSSEETAAPHDEANVFHPGVICDGCEKEIYGPRYKCKQCVDFDLCSSCKEKNTHNNEHEFEKIAKPVHRCPYWNGTQSSGSDPHSWRPHWRQHFRQHWRNQQQNYQQQQQQQQRSRQSVQETLNNFMPHLVNNIPIVNNPEQLKNVGEYLKQFLDPFGIDVSYYVDGLNRNNNNNANETAANNTSNPSSAETAKADASTSSKEEEKKANETSEKPTPMQTEESKSEANKNVADAIINANPTPKEDVVDVNQKANSINVETVTVAAATAAASPFEAVASALKNVIDSQEASTTTAAAAANANADDIPKIKVASSATAPDQEFNGFNLVDMDKEIKFINCIEQLKSMGYTDDGGWLTKLVIAKEGNINAVLDTLQATKN